MNAESLDSILDLLATCKDLTLATVCADGSPQANIVNFANEALTLYFATDRGSEKVRNIQARPRVSIALRVDYEDWTEVRGLSASATAEILPDDSLDAQRAKACLARRYADNAATPSPMDPATTVYIKLVLDRIVLIDYSKGYGHRVHFRIPELS